MATQFGATHIINGSREDVVERVREITGGLGADYSFDAIGTAATTEQIIDVLAPAGHATIVGIPAVEARAKISPMQMVYSEKKVSGTYYGSIRPTIDFGVLADLSMEGKLDLNALISRTYKFDEINEGFQLMAKGQVARGVIEFN
jgi:S-(hydroxymethyl)glutathione dehydrogenase/alcohol dehydrogenase